MYEIIVLFQKPRRKKLPDSRLETKKERRKIVKLVKQKN